MRVRPLGRGRNANIFCPLTPMHNTRACVCTLEHIYTDAGRTAVLPYVSSSILLISTPARISAAAAAANESISALPVNQIYWLLECAACTCLSIPNAVHLPTYPPHPSTYTHIYVGAYMQLFARALRVLWVWFFRVISCEKTPVANRNESKREMTHTLSLSLAPVYARLLIFPIFHGKRERAACSPPQWAPVRS